MRILQAWTHVLHAQDPVIPFLYTLACAPPFWGRLAYFSVRQASNLCILLMGHVNLICGSSLRMHTESWRLQTLQKQDFHSYSSRNVFIRMLIFYSYTAVNAKHSMTGRWTECFYHSCANVLFVCRQHFLTCVHTKSQPGMYRRLKKK